MKKVLSIILVSVILITLTGCNKDKSRFKNEITVECKSKEKSVDGYNDEIKVNYSNKAVFNKDGYLSSAEYIAVYKIATSETYEEYKNALEESEITEYTYDPENKTITSKSVYQTNLEDISDTEKEDLVVEDFITNSEGANYTCTITGATRKEIGLDK